MMSFVRFGGDTEGVAKFDVVSYVGGLVGKLGRLGKARS